MVVETASYCEQDSFNVHQRYPIPFEANVSGMPSNIVALALDFSAGYSEFRDGLLAH